MNHFTFKFKTLLSLLLLAVCTGAWADESVFYTLKAEQSAGNTAYASVYDVTVDDVSWSVPGNQNFDGWWRIGGKSLTNTNRFIMSKDALGSSVSKVTFNHNGKSNNSLTVNSVKLEVSSKADFSSIVETVELNPTIGTGTKGSFTFEPSEDASWPAGSYYRFTINVTNTTTSNYGLDMTSIEFFTTEEVAEKELSSIKLEGTTDIFFNVGDAFNHDGVKVIAVYIDNTTKDVTKDAEFSTPTLSAVGSETVTVSYEGKTATYDVMVIHIATWVAAKQKDYGNAVTLDDEYSVDPNISLAFSKASGSNAPKYYTNGTGARLYVNNTMTVKAAEGYVITAINITFSGASYTGGYKANVGTYKDGQNSSWTGCAPIVEFVPTGTSRMQKVEVKYDSLTELDEITVGSAGYSTYCAPMGVIIGDGTVAKYITGVEKNGTTLTQADANVVAEGEGVLLVGEGTYKVYSHNDIAVTKNAANKLVGVSAATVAPVGSYVLQNQNDVVGFYKVDSEISVPAGKAYLDLGAAGAKAFTFGGDSETAISEIATENGTAAVIYNLAGQRIQKMQKGINIVNGKKVLY